METIPLNFLTLGGVKKNDSALNFFQTLKFLLQMPLGANC